MLICMKKKTINLKALKDVYLLSPELSLPSTSPITQTMLLKLQFKPYKS